MSADAPGESGPTGVGRRRARISDEETERRMLDTALAALARSGLTVSLEHIRLEDIIREAGVSRSAVYRRWPHKDLFLGDLLLELANAGEPLSTPDGRATTKVVREVFGRHLQSLDTAASRWELAVDMLRESAALDFREIHQSAQWRSYLALTVTFLSLPAGELRDQVQEALTTTEQRFTERIAHGYRTITELLGLRLRPSQEVTFEAIANLGNAMLRGMVIKTLAAPRLATERVTDSAFGLDADWTLPELGLTGLINSFLEPDPEIDWEDGRIAALRLRLLSTDNIFDGTHG